MSDLALFSDLTTGRLISRDGGAPILRTLILGDTLRCTLRTMDRVEGDLREQDLRIRTLTATLGKVTEPPTAGQFKLVGQAMSGAVPAQVTFPAANASRLWAVAIYNGDDIAPIIYVDATGQGGFGSLAESFAWFQAAGSPETFTVGGDPAGDIVVTAALLGSARRLVVEYRDHNNEGVLLEDAEEVPHLQPAYGAPINFDANADAFRNAIAGICGAAIVECEKPVAGCWLFRLADNAQTDLEAAENTLRPESFVRFRRFIQSGVWWHEVQLIQAPLAWNEDGHERVLPPPPSVSRVREGKAATAVEPEQNEIQDIFFPPDFRGTYFLRWNFRVTRVLGNEDGPTEIADALNSMFESGGERFAVTNVEPFHEYVEFIGSLGGEAQPLITVEVNTFQPGVLNFALPLDRANLAAELRLKPEIEVPLEVEAEIVDNAEDLDDPAIPGRVVTLFQQLFKVRREQRWKELDVVRRIDFLRPTSPRTYLPFNDSQVLIGNQATYVQALAPLGSVGQRSFSLPHNRHTMNGVFAVRENKPNGKLIPPEDAQGTRWTLTFASDDELILDFPAPRPAPLLNEFVATFTTAGPASAFMQDLHIAIPQVDGLEDALATVNARLEAIEDIMPAVPLARVDEEGEAFTIPIADRSEVFPGQYTEADAAKAARGPGLLPAIHNAQVLPLALPLGDPVNSAGQVFQNTSGGEVIVPRGLGRWRTKLAKDGYLGSDGRVWYRLSKAGATNSYFPADFERELFMFHVNDRMLRAGQTLRVDFQLAVALINATTKAQLLLVIEVGSAPGQVAPAPVSENLLDVQWVATPLLSQRIILSDLRGIPHKFGAQIIRDAAGALSAQRMIYGQWEGGAQVPPSANFAIRARLVNFDTENSVAGATGFVFFAMKEAHAEIA